MLPRGCKKSNLAGIREPELQMHMEHRSLLLREMVHLDPISHWPDGAIRRAEPKSTQMRIALQFMKSSGGRIEPSVLNNHGTRDSNVGLGVGLRSSQLHSFSHVAAILRNCGLSPNR